MTTEDSFIYSLAIAYFAMFLSGAILTALINLK